MDKFTTPILIAIIIILALLNLMPKRKTKKELELNRYYLKKSILTTIEKWIYKIIKEEITEEYIVAPKVGIKDFVGIKKGNDYMKYFGHIAQRHIDFLICKKEDLSPVLGIEIDDTSHEKQNRKNRDQENDDIYKTIGLKIVHIPTKTKEEDVRKIIQEAIKIDSNE